MTNNTINHGFRLKEEEFVAEIDAVVAIMEHEQSGARLMHIKNDDDNKTFAITFRTPPTDDTGLPHILEHSVLCGSRKFPVKEPFVELAKGSLNTYLNAMTFADKTVYPIASQNDKDFVNLMDVYLDAVFYPNIYDNPMILKQEGWSYKLEDKDHEIEYQGVVYNEMKGAFSSPEGLLFRKIKESLFPDTTYGCESGGDPAYIPDLSQEQFLAFHKNYYHPSNSYICLYGDGDIDQHLKLINDEYLSHFNKIEVDSAIEIQKPFPKLKEIELEYPIAEGEGEEEKSYLALNFAIGGTDDTQTILAMEVLQDLLLESPGAPLKKALIDAQIGQDVFASYTTSMRQPVFSIVAKNVSPDKKDAFYKIIKDTLKGLVKDGIDKKLIQGAINSREFELREADFGGHSKGILYATQSLKSWLYDGSPYDFLKYEEDLKRVKKALESSYLEEVIQKYLIDNSHSTLVTMKPKAGLTKELDGQLKEKLKKYKESLSADQIQGLIDDTQKLQALQVSSDTEENLEKIPTLALSDLDKEVKFTDYQVNKEEGIPFVFTPETTNQIAYINMYYDLRGVDEALIPYLGMLVGMLGKLDTKNHSYGELNNKMDISTGGVQYYTLILNEAENPDAYIPKLVVSGKGLYSEMPELSQLIEEIMLRTEFRDPARLREIIREMKSRMEMSISSNGHRIASNRLASYFTQKGYYTELLKGLRFYDFVSHIEANFPAMEDELVLNLEKAYKILNNKSRVSIGLTAEAKEYDKIKDQLLSMTDLMEDGAYEKLNPSFDLRVKNEGLMAPFNVQYVAKGYDFRKLGYSYSGSMNVLKSILGLDYLWNKVRVQNGAYGCFAEFGRSGPLFFVSYRDPSVGKTLQTYDESADYIEKFAVSDRDMVKYIIGTISSLDFPLTSEMKGERSERLYIAGMTREMMQEQRDEILATDQETIRSLAPIVKASMAKNYVCAIGNHDKIKASKDLFEHFVEVFK